MSDADRIAELEASNRELRGALIFAARRIKTFMPRDRSLPLLRQVLREARVVAKRSRQSVLEDGDQ